MARLTAFSRALLRTVGPPTLRRLAPIYCGLAILIAILFGPTGMSADQLIAASHSSPRFRIALYLAWLILIVAAVRPLFTNRQALYLRATPIAPTIHWLVLGSCVLLTQLPWTWLWFRGAGPLPALAATLTAAAICTAAAIAPRNLVERLLIAAGALALLIATAAALADWQQILLASALFVLAIRAAWLRAPERPGAVDLAGLIAGRSGLLIAHAAAVLRRRSSSLGRGAVIVATGGALTGLVARNNDIVSGAGVAELALVFAAIVLTPAAAMIAGPVVDAERSLRWLLDANGVDADRRLFASAGACTAGGVVYAGLFAGLLVWLAPLDPSPALRVFGVVVALAVCLALVSLRCARWAERRDGVDGARLVSASVGVVLVAAVAVGVLGEWALPALAAAAIKLGLGGVR